MKYIICGSMVIILSIVMIFVVRDMILRKKFMDDIIAELEKRLRK